MNSAVPRNLIIAVTFGASALQGTAALSQYRTEVQVSNGGNGTPLEFAFDGGLNATTAHQSLATPTLSGTAEAWSDLSPNGFIPSLRAVATHAGTRAQAVAWAVQGYTNTSGSPLTTTLLLDFTAQVTGSNDVEARLYLFRDENFEYSQDPGTILFESTSQLWPGFEAFANNPGPGGFDVLVGNHEGPVSEQRSFGFTVDPGDSFYVWARLVTTADNTGTADASSTLTASFTNTAGLEPAAVAIPEPGAAALLVIGGGMALVGGRGRRSRRDRNPADGRSRPARN